MLDCSEENALFASGRRQDLYLESVRLVALGTVSRVPTIQSPQFTRFGIVEWRCSAQNRVVSAESLVVMFVSGRITGEHVDVLRGVLEQESGGFAIDLKNVVLVDREAVKFLALSEANGMELRNCSPYSREWVTRERAETHGYPSEQGLEGREDIEDA